MERKLGHWAAAGMIAAFWRLARIYWCEWDAERKVLKKAGIPKTVFGLEEFDAVLLESGLAYESNGFMWASDAEKLFDWLCRATQRGATSHSNKNNGITLPIGNQKQTRRSSSDSPSSSSNSSSKEDSLNLVNNYILSNSESRDVKKTPRRAKPKPTDKTLEERRELKQFWLTTYKQAFGHDYVAGDAFMNLTIKNLHESFGLQAAKEKMAMYVGWRNPNFIKIGHPLHLLRKNLVQMEAEYHRGKEMLAQKGKAEGEREALQKHDREMGGLLTNAKLIRERSANLEAAVRRSEKLPLNAAPRLPQRPGNSPGPVIQSQRTQNPTGPRSEGVRPVPVPLAAHQTGFGNQRAGFGEPSAPTGINCAATVQSHVSDPLADGH